ncbi:hypothetical protein GCM10025876_31580 [Demequina litorisediminis]|uniref:Uncharacterized protein n=1 Tax=Demequina litorisediminis TaxID=1849022 RepID=A0ABQ6IGF6_9MICO|nr:hypothetical protein GCM10025876_31580 [Demequina litorisediminis]
MSRSFSTALRASATASSWRVPEASSLRLEGLDLGVLLGGDLLRCGGGLGGGEVDGCLLLGRGEVEALLEFGIELLGADLVHDVRVARLVDGEGLAAVRAGDLVHA